ncbi:MAG: methyltransferase [Monoraphidium minutum]|nr:MAG: methyltransferase [Monoraphidium minutum]
MQTCGGGGGGSYSSDEDGPACAGGGGSSAAPPGAPGGDGALAGGLLAELRSWARYLLPGRYKAVYYPTPHPIAAAMLRLARVGPDDVVYDLGCGDGRIVIAAAQQMGAKRCVGIELDPRLAAAARRAVAAAGLDAAGRVAIVEGDAAAADLSDASVVALYLSDAGNRDLLAAVGPSLRRGARVVSLYFPVAGWEASLAAHDTSAGIDIYLYSAP